ncbi:hypothetical protein B0O99DRAFT_308673 [Bisporella sp. PMI_857]|nr:hypothetical protein B0O99DRAFT_308673 [Bisporella sp. PMI_857]
MSIEEPEKALAEPTTVVRTVPDESSDAMVLARQLRLTVQEQTSESEEPKVAVPKVALCGVCSAKESKYKCSRCYLPYCSVACHTIHKTTHPAEEHKPTLKMTEPPKLAVAYRPGTIGSLKNPFAALDDSVNLLEKLFSQYPRLPAQLLEIHSATLQPETDEENEAQLQLIRESRKESSEQGITGRNPPWSNARGEQSGVQALKNARRVYGKDGEGIRQYGELILQILQGDNEVDAAEALERERREEDAKLISQLLEAES